MILCSLLLSQRQMPLTLAVVIQPKERQPRSCKGKTPFRQNRRPYIKNTANRSRVFSSIQKQKRTCTFPDKGINDSVRNLL